MTVNTATDRSTIAPTPKATAAICIDTPSWPPTAVPTPAARPSIRDLLITKSTFGPGTMISANESSANASTWLAGIIRLAYGPAGRRQCQVEQQSAAVIKYRGARCDPQDPD